MIDKKQIFLQKFNGNRISEYINVATLTRLVFVAYLWTELGFKGLRAEMDRKAISIQINVAEWSGQQPLLCVPLPYDSSC